MLALKRVFCGRIIVLVVRLPLVSGLSFLAVGCVFVNGGLEGRPSEVVVRVGCVGPVRGMRLLSSLSTPRLLQYTCFVDKSNPLRMCLGASIRMGLLRTGGMLFTGIGVLSVFRTHAGRCAPLNPGYSGSSQICTASFSGFLTLWGCLATSSSRL